MIDKTKDTKLPGVVLFLGRYVFNINGRCRIVKDVFILSAFCCCRFWKHEYDEKGKSLWYRAVSNRLSNIGVLWMFNLKCLPLRIEPASGVYSPTTVKYRSKQETKWTNKNSNFIGTRIPNEQLQTGIPNSFEIWGKWLVLELCCNGIERK